MAIFDMRGKQQISAKFDGRIITFPQYIAIVGYVSFLDKPKCIT